MPIEGFGFLKPPQVAEVPVIKPEASVSVPEQTVSVSTEANRAKKMSHFSLRNFIKEAMERNNDEAAGANIPAKREVFDANDVSMAISEYLEARKGDNTLRLALSSKEPKVLGFSVTLTFESSVMHDIAEDHRIKLEQFLSEKLNNSELTLCYETIEVSDAETGSSDMLILATAKEKLAYFEEQNPAVATLVNKLSLELD